MFDGQYLEGQGSEQAVHNQGAQPFGLGPLGTYLTPCFLLPNATKTPAPLGLVGILTGPPTHLHDGTWSVGRKHLEARELLSMIRVNTKGTDPTEGL